MLGNTTTRADLVRELVSQGYTPQHARTFTSRVLIITDEAAPVPEAPAGPVPEPTNAALRAWAKSAGVRCPARGRVPGRVRAAFHAAH